MPKINVYLPEDLADAVRDAQVPVSAICQSALERAVRDVSAMRGSDQAPGAEQPSHGPFMNFTPRARNAIASAQSAATQRDHNFVGTEHLLLGVLDESANMALAVLRSLDVDPADVRHELVASMPGPSGGAVGQVPFTPLAKKALELSVKESHGLRHTFVGCEHLLLGVLATEDGLGSKVLRRMGIEPASTRRAVVTALSGYFHQRREQEPVQQAAPEPVLDEILRRLEAIERRLAS